VNGRHEADLRARAEMVIREQLPVEVILTWRKGETLGGVVRVMEWTQEPGLGYPDGSRMDGVTGAATAEKGKIPRAVRDSELEMPKPNDRGS